MSTLGPGNKVTPALTRVGKGHRFAAGNTRQKPVPDTLLLSKHEVASGHTWMGSRCKKPAHLHLGRIPLGLCASTFPHL